MSGPNHLWSGDWEDESARAARERAAQPQIEATEPAPLEQQPREAGSSRRRLSLRYAAIAGLLVVVVGVALAVTLSGGSKPKQARTASRVAATPPTPSHGPTGGVPLQSTKTVGNGPVANWLGMQIVDAPGGAAIDTVALGSAADDAGFEPGDVIVEIDGHQINTVPQIAAATSKVALGKSLSVEVLRSSVMVMLSSVPMEERPTIRP
jgi:membrane-associated protease RseP (regulator of RpoE activity)